MAGSTREILWVLPPVVRTLHPFIVTSNLNSLGVYSTFKAVPPPPGPARALPPTSPKL